MSGVCDSANTSSSDFVEVLFEYQPCGSKPTASSDANDADCSVVYIGHGNATRRDCPRSGSDADREVFFAGRVGGASTALRRSILQKYDRIRRKQRRRSECSSIAAPARFPPAAVLTGSNSDVTVIEQIACVPVPDDSQVHVQEVDPAADDDVDVSIEFIGLCRADVASPSVKRGSRKRLSRGRRCNRVGALGSRRRSGVCVGRVGACASFRPCYANSFRDRRKRLVVVDGANIAFCHGKHRFFSVRGIELVIGYFRALGLKCTTFLSSSFLDRLPAEVTQVLRRLEESGDVVFTPSRCIDGVYVSSYDDRYIVMHATEEDAVILSGDKYRDVADENPLWKKTIESRLLIPVFVGDKLILPPDPLGRFGPPLEEFLTFPSS